MKTYSIKITGSKYNDDYFFFVPKDGEIEEEVAAIMEEMKAGSISKFTVEEVEDTCKKTVPCCGMWDLWNCIYRKMKGWLILWQN